MNAATMPTQRGPAHGNYSRKLPPVLATNLVLADGLASQAAFALKTAASVKAVQEGGGVEKSSASRWRTDGKGGVVFDFDVLLFSLAQRAGARAGVLIAHAKSILMQALMPISDSDLVARWWLLCGLEAKDEGRENEAVAMYARTGDLLAVAEADEREAGVQEERSACAREMHRRGIDPRDPKWGAR